jgi:large subunit ribosomal protein L6
MLSLKIPKDINILINENWIEIKGPLGIIKKKKSNSIKITYDSKTNILYLLNENTKINHFYISMIYKLLWGVWKGYSIKLNIVGVGYKAFLEKDKLVLKIGFSHNVTYNIPKNITIKILNQKLLTILITGTDFQKITQTAAEIKYLKPVEPYKGKGIRYFNEIIQLKEGKKTNV